ncbi:MAG: carbohydrate kinase family protein, partial [Spirochaetia bacterium]
LGSMVLTAEQQFVQPAFTVPVKDTTGAGDCFNAVFLSCLAAGQGVQQACLYGTAAAALAIQSVGSRTSFPSRAEVESFLSSHAPGEPETGRTNGRA